MCAKRSPFRARRCAARRQRLCARCPTPLRDSQVSSACDSVWSKSNAWRSGGGKRQSEACALCSTTACARLSYRTDTSACYWSMPAAGWIHGSSLCMLGVGSIAQQVVLPLAARSSLAAAVKYDAQDQIRTNTRPSARGRREAGGAGGRRGGCARRPELPARTTTRSVVRKKGTKR